MKKNDIITHKNKVAFTVLSSLCLIVGALLVAFKPRIWIVSEITSAQFGVLLILLAFMYIPCVIYRLISDKRTK